jgi:hypothetical protein
MALLGHSQTVPVTFIFRPDRTFPPYQETDNIPALTETPDDPVAVLFISDLAWGGAKTRDRH